MIALQATGISTAATASISPIRFMVFDSLPMFDRKTIRFKNITFKPIPVYPNMKISVSEGENAFFVSYEARFFLFMPSHFANRL